MNVELDEWQARAQYAVVQAVRVGAQRDEWKTRAEKAEARLAAVAALCDERERAWSEGVRKPSVPTWIAKVRAALGDGQP